MENENIINNEIADLIDAYAANKERGRYLLWVLLSKIAVRKNLI